jgi:magnesium chelatase accessory protein
VHPPAAPLAWDVDGRDWPLREHSRFVEAAGLRWHVQHLPAPVSGAPVALLLHGTGASAHSWRDVAPRLHARGFEVLAPDLPGHAFTSMPPERGPGADLCSLAGMARGVTALLAALQSRPDLLVGHSAGAAVAIRLCLDGLAPRLIAGLNGALLPWAGWVGPLFAPVARAMAATSLVPRLFARQAADPAVVLRLLDGTGSRLEPEGRALYARLVRAPAHATGALRMMAGWDLQAFARELPRLGVPLHLIVGTGDRTVPPEQADRVVHALRPAVRRPVVRLEGLGHLAHEESPAEVVRLVGGRYDAEVAAAQR